MSFNLRQKTLDFLRANLEKKFAAREIAEGIFKQYPNECLEKKNRSKNLVTDDNVVQQIAAEIAASRIDLQKAHPQIKTTEDRPRQYYFTNKTDLEVAHEIEQKGNLNGLKEADLYPLLIEFLQSEHIYGKRINDKLSSNKGESGTNQWLFPDVIAAQNLTEHWDAQLQQSSSVPNDKKVNLFSFEVKLLINKANIRSHFFQTVSNSSWANYGYLVAEQLDSDAENELRMLSNLYGIGFISLDRRNLIEGSKFMLQAKRREIDWNMVNRLITENPEIRKCITLLEGFYKHPRADDLKWNLI